MNIYTDVREWLKQAENIGELQVVEDADPHLEVGTITQVDSKNEGPAVLFDSLKGYKKGFRILTNVMSNTRTLNLSIGLPLENNLRDIVEAIRFKPREWEEKANDFPVKEVASGPVLENVVEGDAIDLEQFPVPMWHELDGGKFIGTAVGVITKDPDTGDLNMGTYRAQLFDKRCVGSYMTVGKQGRLHRDKYFERGQPCPQVVVVGLDPLSFALSATEVPRGVFELDYLGAIMGKKLPVIKGKVTGLPIPANAEIVIEGFADPKETKIEGPFGEWPGTYASKPSPQPFVKADALYYRNDPILTGSPPAKSTYFDAMLLRCVWRSSHIYNEIAKSGIPNIKGVWCPPLGGSRLLVVVAIKQSYPGHATEVGHIASQTRAGAYAGRYVIVVDDDINPYDLDDVMWAVVTRSDPTEMDIIKRAWSGPVDPRPSKDDIHLNNRGIIYAVKPYEHFDDFPPTALASESLRKDAFTKWSSIFSERWKVY